MRRLLLCGVAIVGCAIASGSRVAVAQGATSCDSPCKVMHLPLIGPRGAVCDSPCKLINLPLVHRQQDAVPSSNPLGELNRKMPFIVGKISADSMDRIEAARPRNEHEVDKPATLAPGSPAPIYPESLKIKRVEGDFVAQFIVDTTGRVEVASFRVVKRGHPLFIAAVRDALPAMRFIPAEVKGEKVRQWVVRPFVFNLPH